MPAASSILLNLLGRSWLGSTTLPSDVGGYLDDIIRLGDQNLAVRGVSVVEQVSEFESGIKIGPATYDNREHAFFIVMNDFSAGMGYHFIDLREELGGYWDVDDESGNALDVSREKYMLLPPKQTDVVDESPEFNLYGAAVSVANHMRRYSPGPSGLGGHFILCGSAIYVSYDGGYTFDKEYDIGEDGILLSIVVTNEQIFGVGTLMVGGTGPTLYVKSRIHTTGSAIYPPEVWSPMSRQAVGQDLYWWDEKIMVQETLGVLFGVWERDADTDIIDVFWSVQNPFDGEYIFKKAVANYENVWASVAMAPWGQPALYFVDDKRLYALDFFARKYYPIEFGIGRNITGVTNWNGAIVTVDGFNAWEYNANGATVRNIGLRDKEGMPPSLQGTSIINGDWVMRAPFPIDKDLYSLETVINAGNGTPKTKLMKFNGKGWHQVGQPVDYMGHAGAHMVGGFYSENKNRRSVVVWGTDLDREDPVMTHTIYQLPTTSDTPIPGKDAFGTSGAGIITGWMNGGFSDLDGTLLRMKIDGMYLTDTEKFGVEYQLDGDEDMAWIRMVDKDNAEAYFDEDHDTLFFSPTPASVDPYNPRQGIQFNSVRFRIRGYRGSNELLSPVAKAFTLMYIKVPEFRLAATFTVDINRMLEATKAGGTEYYVDGAAPTLRSIHRKLIALWDEHLLHQLVVPNVITDDDQCFVRIVGMPLRFDDFKDAIAGRGTIELSLIEPLERVE
jgi:hypothetical protein